MLCRRRTGLSPPRRRRQPSSWSDDHWLSAAAAELPLCKLSQVYEIAEFVVLLLSERSDAVTGSVIDWDQNVLGCYD